MDVSSIITRLFAYDIYLNLPHKMRENLLHATLVSEVDIGFHFEYSLFFHKYKMQNLVIFY